MAPETFHRENAEELDLWKGIRFSGDTDLTKHILNAHGLAAQQYHICNEQPLVEEVERQKTFTSKRYWVRDWLPRKRWMSWPLPPNLVPHMDRRVWATSTFNKSPWKPSRDLEEYIFAAVLKNAHLQWKRRTESTSRNSSKIKDLRGQRVPTASSTFGGLQAKNKNRKKRQRPVMSADDDRSRRLVQPIVRSTLSNLDKVLMALHRSQIGMIVKTSTLKQILSKTLGSTTFETQLTPNQEKSNDNAQNPNGAQLPQVLDMHDRDWSQVLGLAAMVGIPPSVISRTATRCTAAFGESMSFKTVREEDVVSRTPVPVQQFRPSDIKTRLGENRFAEPRISWDLKKAKACPYRTCEKWNARHGDATPERIYHHLIVRHHWSADATRKGDGIFDMEAEFSGMVGAVHTNGFLRPIRNIKHQAGKALRDRRSISRKAMGQ